MLIEVMINSIQNRRQRSCGSLHTSAESWLLPAALSHTASGNLSTVCCRQSPLERERQLVVVGYKPAAEEDFIHKPTNSRAGCCLSHQHWLTPENKCYYDSQTHAKSMLNGIFTLLSNSGICVLIAIPIFKLKY